MRKTLLAIVVLFSAGQAMADGVKDAMKKIGPAYMCGANYEYAAALDNLRAELIKVGLSESMADAALASVKDTSESNASIRAKLTAEDCAAKYGHTISN